MRETKVVMPDVTGMSMREVLRTLSPYRLQLKFSGSGVAIKQLPYAGREIRPGTECLVTFRK